MNIAIVANCQARPIAALTRALVPTVADPQLVIVHLARKDGAGEDYALLDTADWIFAQFVTDQYFAGHLATSRLRNRYGNRVISWPNIFFRGQTPDLAYASIPRADKSLSGRLLGPLREYHHRGILTAWQAGMSPSECLGFLEECPNAFREESFSIAERSLQELIQREADLDIKISDLVTEEWRQRRLFFTFNHPSAYLLAAMAKRLLSQAGLETTGDTSSEREPLDLVIPPVFGRDKAILGSALGQSETSRGAHLLIEGDKVQLGKARLYAHLELIETSYIAYDAQLSREDHLAFSPP